MPVLERKMLRDLWQVRWRALMVVLTIAAGVGIYAGIGMAIATGFHTRAVLFDRMGFADLEVQFLPEDVANLPDLTGVPGIRAIERRLVLPGTVSLPGGGRIAGVLVFLEAIPPAIDALEIVAGRPLGGDGFEGAVIERSLATFHGVRVGDRIAVQVGEKTYESRVVGVAVSPEWLIVSANPDYFVPEKGSVGVVFADLARVSDALGFTMVNDLLFRLEPGADRRAVKDAVVARLARLNLERVTMKEEHFIWRHMQLTLEAFGFYVPSLVLILGSLSFVLTLMTVHRLVLDRRKEIGALLALGYRRSRVLRAHLTLGAVLGSAGGVIGLGLAFVFRNLFAETCARAIGLPEVITVVVPGLLAGGFGAAVVGAMTATALPVGRMLRLSPQAIIRAPARERAGFEGWIRWTFASMARLPMPLRFGLRNMVRRPGRTLASILAIGFSLGVALAYVMSLTSALQTSELVFARERWDLAVDFLYPVLLEDLEAIRSQPGASRVEPYFRRFAEIGVNGRYESARILGVRPDSEMKRTVLKAGRFLSGPADELLVSQDLARRLGVRIGDRVSIRVRSGRESVFRVVGIAGEVIPAQVMMSFGQAQALTEFDDAATGVYIATSGAAPRLVEALSRLEFVAKVTTKASVAMAFQKLMSEMLQVVYLACGVSVFVAMLFIVMSVNFTIGERQAEYATFACLGYGRVRLGLTILSQAFGEGGLAALVSIPIGAALAVYLNARMSHAWYEVIDIFRLQDVAQILGVALALIPVSSYPGLRALNRLNVVQALGSRTIE